MSRSPRSTPERILTVVGAILLASAALAWILLSGAPEQTAHAESPPPSAAPTHTPASPTPTSTSTTPTHPVSAGPTQAADAPSTSAPELVSDDGAGDRHEHAEQVTGTPTAATTTQRQRWQQARSIAVAAVAAFARPGPGVSEDQWWQAARVHLSEQAIDDYIGADPARVSWSSVEGSGVMVPSEAPDQLLMIVDVPVDTGTVRVELTTTVEEKIQVAWIGLVGS